MANRGGFSIIRVGVIAAVIGFIIVVFGVASFLLDQSSRGAPLAIAPYPNAIAWGTRPLTSASRSVYYQVRGVSPEDVAAYYQQKLHEHYGDNSELCVRVPSSGQFTDIRTTGGVPYEFICMFDHSGFRSTQYTKVTIQPGVFNTDPAYNTEGMTIVEHEEHWQP